MSTKINIALFIFGLMIQAIFCGILLILPPSVTASFPFFVNPNTVLASITTPVTYFGISAVSFDTTCESAFCDCSIGTLYLGCIGYALGIIGSFLMMIFSFLVMVLNVVIYLLSFIFLLIIFFITSSFFVISSFPLWLAIPFGIFLTAINILVVVDIILVVKGLFENLI